jgi:hypothetical protein
MMKPPAPIPVRPRPRPVRTLGILNILFGAILLAYSWLMIGSFAFNGMSAGPAQALEAAIRDHAKVDHDAAIRRLGALERRASSEEVRDLYRAERLRREGEEPKVPPAAEMLLMGGRMRGMMAWTGIGAVLGLGLNLLLIASGVGLVQRVEWGRRLGLWAAGLKLPVVLVMQVLWLAWIVPSLSRAIGDSVGGMMSAQRGGMPAGMPNMTQLYAVIYTLWGVFVLVAGSIYPIILLVMLRRPGIRAACEPAGRRGRAMLLEAARS